MKDGRVSFARLGMEFLSIVTGIFLALMANDYYQNRVDHRLGREALAHIRHEIQSNKLEIEKKMPRMQAVHALLETYQDQKDQSLVAIIGEMNKKLGHGFDAPLLQQAAFASARSTGVVKYIKYEIVRELSIMDSMEDLIDKRTDRMLALVYSPDIIDARHTQGLVITGKLLGADNIGTMKHLLKIYDKNLALIGEELD